ncbi:hypothetical protein Goari_005171 [Gossypium aridum]|uniref:Uncharacterized protein n=1 Tax=Gossypium aridum TaxID=34290 RepID=A0A7J8Y7G2_GOSAI|nr:hypothetical protein [Gossypium aridum]
MIPLGSEGPDGAVSYEHCFVGSFLTSSGINFPSMKVTLANVDVDRIEAGGSWTFKSHLLVMHRLRGREDPMVSLVTIDF